MEVTQEHEKRDIQYLKFGPIKIDKTLSIPNVIQIMLLLFAIWAGGWRLYGEFVDMRRELTQIKNDVRSQLESQASVIGIYDTRLVTLNDRINQQGTEIALSKQRLDSLSTSIDKLTNAIERFRESSQSRGTPG
jgi:hypothetical protein